MQDPPLLGRRIVVWGVTGSGKTTLARHLGKLLGLGVIELDAIRHRHGWDSVELDDMRLVLSERLASLPDGWVIDGGYYSAVGDLYIPSADTVIWLHLPWRVSFWRLFWRTVTHAWTREPVFDEDGPHESWRLSFLDRRSILWWSISNHRTSVRNARERIEAMGPGVAVYELRSPREVREFLDNLKKSAASDALPAC